MRVLVLVKASKGNETGVISSDTFIQEMGFYTEALSKAGILLAGEDLLPSSYGIRVRMSGKERTVIHGPFQEIRDLLSAFWIWQVKSMEEAIDWVKKYPNPVPGESSFELEIRPLCTPDNFETVSPSGELRFAGDIPRTVSQGRPLDPPSFKQIKEKTIIGHNVTYDMESRTSIPDQWANFVPHLGKVPGQIGKDSYGVSWNFKKGSGFDYLCGVEVNPETAVPSLWARVTLPGQLYAVFTHKEHVSQLPEMIDAIWNDWIPFSGHKPSPKPCFEKYDESFNGETGMGGMEIWVPIES